MANGSRARGPEDELASETTNVPEDLNEDTEGEPDIETSGTSNGQEQHSNGNKDKCKKKNAMSTFEREFAELSKLIHTLVEVEKESTMVMHEIKESFTRPNEQRKKNYMDIQTLACNDLSPIQIMTAASNIIPDDKKLVFYYSLPEDELKSSLTMFARS